jgi:type II secretion system protein H
MRRLPSIWNVARRFQRRRLKRSSIRDVGNVALPPMIRQLVFARRLSVQATAGSHGDRSGFTLVELMVVLLIMTMLASLVAPSVAAAMRRNGVETTGRKLTELTRFAALSAVTRHTPVALNLDPNRGRCWVSVNSVRLPWQEKETQRDHTARVLATLEIPRGVLLRFSRTASSTENTEPSHQRWNSVTFHPDGRAEDASLELAAVTGEEFDITIFGITGEISANQRKSHEK